MIHIDAKDSSYLEDELSLLGFCWVGIGHFGPFQSPTAESVNSVEAYVSLCDYPYPRAA